MKYTAALSDLQISNSKSFLPIQFAKARISPAFRQPHHSALRLKQEVAA